MVDGPPMPTTLGLVCFCLSLLIILFPVDPTQQNAEPAMRAWSDTPMKNETDVKSQILWLFAYALFSFGAWFIWDLGITPNEVWTGVPLHKSRTKIFWPNDKTVKNSIVVKVKFFSLTGEPICDMLKDYAPRLKSTVTHSSGREINSSLAEPDSDELCIIFSGRLSGVYKVELELDGCLVRGFPSIQFFEPGVAHHAQTSLFGLPSRTFVVKTTSFASELTSLSATWWQPHVALLCLEPRDWFGNLVHPSAFPDVVQKLSIDVWKRVDERSKRKDMKVNDDCFNSLFYQGPTGDKHVSASITFQDGNEGWYTVQINLDGQPIGSQELTFIVLSANDYLEVDRMLEVKKDSCLSNLYFEAELLSESESSKSKRVYCYLTNKQLVIKEYVLRLFPRTLQAFRFSPTTKLDLVNYTDCYVRDNGTLKPNPVLRIEDGSQVCRRLSVKNGIVFVATYQLALLRKMGGSLSFEDKRRVFNERLVEHHETKGQQHVHRLLIIDRENIVESSMRETKRFTEADWRGLLEITFLGEPGIDQGGVRREWCDLLCKQLFHPSHGLFVQTEEGSEAVHPNPLQRDMRSFVFAGKIVGKCLLESACGSTYRQHVPARLAKSFLAQLVGLRVRYQHFADDCPQFYRTKVHLILTKSVEEEGSGLDDLTFTEEEHVRQRVVCVVDLKPNGSKVGVTDSNKLEYLDALAQHRLCNSFKSQTSMFLEGLHSMVPEHLLSFFDESELELLICGSRSVDLKAWRKHHVVVRDGNLTDKTIEWFWIAVSNFTSDQLSKLLQFSTGSSRLPAGGFQELKPCFQISGLDISDGLPTAHTCFNMICLSNHSRYENFEKTLILAIEWGCEGFGLR